MQLLSIFAAGAAALALAACGQNTASGEGRSAFERDDDRAIGDPGAPVTVIEYASVACPACATWHALAKPTVEDYIESGDVRYVFRPMITGQRDMAIAGFMLANCAEGDQYFDVLDLLFEQQQALISSMRTGRTTAQFRTIARSAGFSDAEYRSCMEDQDNLAAVREDNQQAADDGVGATPTFIINGQQLGSASHSEIDGPAYAVDGQPLVDEQGPIPATFEGETFERIILYFKARAEGSGPGGDGGAE